MSNVPVLEHRSVLFFYLSHQVTTHMEVALQLGLLSRISKSTYSKECMAQYELRWQLLPMTVILLLIRSTRQKDPVGFHFLALHTCIRKNSGFLFKRMVWESTRIFL